VTSSTRRCSSGAGEYEVDTVIHLAARRSSGLPTATRSRPSSRTSPNLALLEACRRSPLVRRVVLASSDKAYGEHETLPYRRMPAAASIPTT